MEDLLTSAPRSLSEMIPTSVLAILLVIVLSLHVRSFLSNRKKYIKENKLSLAWLAVCFSILLSMVVSYLNQEYGPVSQLINAPSEMLQEAFAENQLFRMAVGAVWLAVMTTVVFIALVLNAILLFFTAIVPPLLVLTTMFWLTFGKPKDRSHQN